MIDTHFHLLPALDDGPAGWEESAEMTRVAAADGCTGIVSTSHLYHPAWPEITAAQLRDLFAEARERFDVELNLHLGAEIRVRSGYFADLDRAHERLVPMAGSRYLLLELSPFGPDYAEVVHETAVAGYRPVLAHAELISGIGDDPGRARQLREVGALFQLTAASVCGANGRTPRRRVWGLIAAGCADFVASDAHGAHWRPPGLSAAAAVLRERLGDEETRRLVEVNPQRVVDDVEI